MRASLIFGGLILASLGTRSYGACPSGVSTELKVAGSTICLIIDDAALTRQQQVLRTWIDRSARIVADWSASTGLQDRTLHDMLAKAPL